jgi:hypothetical protein
MSTILVQLTGTQTPVPAANAPFQLVALTGTDNSGAPLSATLNGSESPPWSVTLTGVDGPNEVNLVAQALDTAGANLGSPFTLTESGTGGQPATFFQTTGGTVTVTG